MFSFKKAQKYFSQGNRLELLINGEEFFPRLIERINEAQSEIFLETFILANDKIGEQLHQALKNAAMRGVWVSVTVDSWGSFYLDTDYINSLTDAGVVFQIYDPQPSWYRGRPKLFRRLHRKLVTIDGRYAFIGGINCCYDHMMECGPGGKQDYAVEVEGAVVKEIRELCKSYVRDADDNHLGTSQRYLNSPYSEGDSDIAFVSRDNSHHRTSIENSYIAGIHKAQKRVWMANAYFFPSYRMIRAIKKACRRGVDVRLILQGDPDIPFALTLARTLYQRFGRYGVKIYEFKNRPLHAKIAIIDDEWSTIGSSNLDPLSLAFNLEANIFVKNKAFNTAIGEQITLLQKDSELIEQDWMKRRQWWLLVKDFLMYHALRHFPAVAGLLPAHTPRVRKIKPHTDTQEGRSKEPDLRKAYPESRYAQKAEKTEEYEIVDEAHHGS